MGRRTEIFAIVLLGIALGGCSEERTLLERQEAWARDEKHREDEQMRERHRRASKLHQEAEQEAQRRALERIPAIAASCAKTLSSRDPIADARTAFGAGERRLLSWRSGGGSWTPGLIECDSRAYHHQPRGLPPLPLGVASTTDYATLEDALWYPCRKANHLYGKAFNLEMLKLSPGAIETSCRPKAIPPTGPAPATAKAPLQELLTSEDYPVNALRGGQEGIVRVRLSVGPEGRVGQCDVIKSSRSESLDSTTCRLLRSRGRFKPARDRTGQPIAATVYHSQSWRLPEE